MIASVQDGDRTISVTTERRLRGVTIDDDALEAATIAFLTEGKLPRPSRLNAVAAGEVTLLGEGEESRFRLESPLATYVAERRPPFRWSALPTATSYVVGVFDGEFNEVARSEPIKATEWRPVVDLPRGQTLRWQVEATLADGTTVTAPRVEDGEAKFALLSERDAKQIAALEQRYRDSKVVLAVAYASVGMREEAERLASEIAR